MINKNCEPITRLAVKSKISKKYLRSNDFLNQNVFNMYQSETEMTFSARDESPLLAAGGEVTYSLYHRVDGQEWQLLGAKTVNLEIPALETQLVSVHPNPFNPHTTVSFSVDKPQKVCISVYNITI